MSLLYTLQDLGEQDKAIRSHQEPIMGTAEDRFSERIAIGFAAGDRQRQSRTRLCSAASRNRRLAHTHDNSTPAEQDTF
jgi:hypothetical protein